MYSYKNLSYVDRFLYWVYNVIKSNLQEEIVKKTMCVLALSILMVLVIVSCRPKNFVIEKVFVSKIIIDGDYYVFFTRENNRLIEFRIPKHYFDNKVYEDVSESIYNHVLLTMQLQERRGFKDYLASEYYRIFKTIELHICSINDIHL